MTGAGKARRLLRSSLVAAAAAGCAPASAQQQQQAQQQVQPLQTPPASNDWAKLPRLQLERQFAGPLQDTIVQRWRDPVDGTVCYIYLPITAAHSAPTQAGFVQYGANTIGSISCVATGAPRHPPAPK
jgi:hypothetical protein